MQSSIGLLMIVEMVMKNGRRDQGESKHSEVEKFQDIAYGTLSQSRCQMVLGGGGIWLNLRGNVFCHLVFRYRKCGSSQNIPQLVILFYFQWRSSINLLWNFSWVLMPTVAKLPNVYKMPRPFDPQEVRSKDKFFSESTNFF